MIFWLFKRERKIGLALGGGAARGLAHIGVLKVLKENKIPIHFIAGTSSGALIGALFSSGMEIEIMAKASQRVGCGRFVRLTLEKTGPLSGEAIEKFLDNNIGPVQFSELKIPLAVVATDLVSGKEIVIKEGKVAPAVRASAAFPGIFSPVKMDKKVLVDGGVVSNVPVEIVKDMGAEVIIAVDVIPKARMPREPENIIEVIDRSVDLILKKSSLPSLAKAGIIIEPVTEYIGSIALERSADLIKMGEKATEELIPLIKAKVF